MRRRHLTSAGLLLLLCSASAFAQIQSTKQTQSSLRNKPPAITTPQKSQDQAVDIPQTLRVGDTDLPLTEIIPRTEAAQRRLGEIRDLTKDETLQELQRSLAVLSEALAGAKEEALYQVREARSAEQIAEERVSWHRYRWQLENLNAAVLAHIQSQTGAEKEVSAIARTWSLTDEAARGSTLPEGLSGRMQSVREAASTLDAALRSSLESLVQLQVQISDQRKIVDEVSGQIDAAEKRLRESVFAADGPPLWSALRGTSYASVKEQARLSIRIARSQCATFYRARGNSLLAYFFFFLLLIIVFRRLQRNLEREAAQETLESSGILRSSFALAAFVSLFLLGIIFPEAPPRVVRMSLFLSAVPAIRIVFAVFERELRLPLCALTVFYALDVASGHIAAGTLLRRLLVFALTLGSLVIFAVLLRPGSPVKLLLAKKQWTAADLLSRLAFLLLGGSVLSNLPGRVSLADWLMHGTLRSIYAAVAIYLMYLATSGMISSLATTRLGQASRSIRLHRALVLSRLDKLLKFVGWITWVASALASFQILRGTLLLFRNVLALKWTIGTASVSVEDIVGFLLVLVLSSLVARFIRFFLEEELLPRTGLSPGVAQSSSRLAQYALVMAGFFLALAAAGLDLNRITLLTGAFGVGLGFGLQNVVANFVSGIIISMERPMQVGDLIELGNVRGKVTNIGFRSSTVRTVEGAEVIVPNSELVTKPFVNWSLTGRVRRCELRIGVAYGTNPALMIAILTKVVESHPAVLKEPAPQVAFDRFGQLALEFCVRFWTALEQVDRVRSDLNILAVEELAKNKIDVSRREVQLHLTDSETHAIAQERRR